MIGGGQTPWASNIDAATFYLYNIPSIRDASENELISFASVASAVNEITITNAATGGNPSITASGGDTNIDLNIGGKGGGTITTLTSIDMDNKEILDFALIGQNGTRATTGAVRLTNNGLLAWRNSSNTTNLILDVTSNFLELKNFNGIDMNRGFGQGSDLDFTIDSAVADDTVISEIRSRALDGVGAIQNYARITGVMESDVDTSEDGSMHFYVTEAGTHDVEYMNLNDASNGHINILKALNLNDTDMVLGTTTGTKIGTATGQKIGFWNATPVVQPTGAGADLTNNVTVGGTNNTIADFTDLSTYANDAATIRNDIYQLARSVKFLQDSIRLMGLNS